MDNQSPRITKKNVSLNSELKLLREHYPDTSLTEGRLIEYEELEILLQQKRTSCRFKAIISKWRNQILNTAHKDFVCKINEGYEVADNSQRLLHAHSLQQQGVRKFQKSALVQDTINTSMLSQDERDIFNRMRQTSSAIEGFSFKKELPRPTI